jgi:hypothetical protein
VSTQVKNLDRKVESYHSDGLQVFGLNIELLLAKEFKYEILPALGQTSPWRSSHTIKMVPTPSSSFWRMLLMHEHQSMHFLYSAHDSQEQDNCCRWQWVFLDEFGFFLVRRKD